MASPKFIELLEQLLAATKSGKAPWEQTAREGVFRIILGEGLIRVESGNDSTEKRPRRAAYLLDHKGQIIDQVTEMKSEIEIDMDMFRFLDDLYQNARQSTYKVVDEVADSMLAALEDRTDMHSADVYADKILKALNIRAEDEDGKRLKNRVADIMREANRRERMQIKKRLRNLKRVGYDGMDRIGLKDAEKAVG